MDWRIYLYNRSLFSKASKRLVYLYPRNQLATMTFNSNSFRASSEIGTIHSHTPQDLDLDILAESLDWDCFFDFGESVCSSPVFLLCIDKKKNLLTTEPHDADRPQEFA